MTIQRLTELIYINKADFGPDVRITGLLLSENVEFALRHKHGQTFPGVLPRYVNVEHMRSDINRDKVNFMGIPIYSNSLVKDNEVKFICEKA